MFIKQKVINIKWEKSCKLTLKIELIIFTTTFWESNLLVPSCYKLTKNLTKSLKFTTFGILHLKKLMIVKTFTV